jgi:hypothetical protein
MALVAIKPGNRKDTWLTSQAGSDMEQRCELPFGC